MKPILLLLVMALAACGADFDAHRNIYYTDSDTARQSLDIYAPKGAKDLPVVVWIHGGGWRRGSKLLVQSKPQAFVDEGYVFVSINYRFVPTVEMDGLASDVASAIKWVHDHIAEYGGSPDLIFLSGHSAGAHLTALVGTDVSYLEHKGLNLSDLQGCIPVDTATYDAAKLIDSVSGARAELYTNAFGKEAASQKKYSPITHVKKGQHYPPFLLLHVAARLDAASQSKTFAKALVDVGSQAEVVPARGKTHATINKELGTKGDEPTKAVFAFLKQRVAEVRGQDSPAPSE